MVGSLHVEDLFALLFGFFVFFLLFFALLEIFDEEGDINFDAEEEGKEGGGKYKRSGKKNKAINKY